jgi:acyl-CoA synthetase (AMP-forming)/AMP-acid ligase II
MRGLMMDSALTLSALLRHTERIRGAREVVSRRADRSTHYYTYRDCLYRARRLGAALHRLGALAGDRIATFAWNQVPSTSGKRGLSTDDGSLRNQGSHTPTPAACISISTSRGPGDGTGSVCSVSTSGGPKRSIAAARIVAGTSGAIRAVVLSVCILCALVAQPR